MVTGDFHIRQAAGQAVINIRFKTGYPGAAGRENLAVAEKNDRRVFRQHLIQLMVNRLTLFDVEQRVAFVNQLIDLRIVIARLFGFSAVEIPYAVVRVVERAGAKGGQS